jgi:hypothetical protein
MAFNLLKNSKMTKTILLGTILFFMTNPVLCQRKIRKDFKNEIYAATYLLPIVLNPIGLGYERVILQKRSNFLSLENEFTFSHDGADGNKIQSLIKWNRQKKDILSFGAGFSYRLNLNINRFTYLLKSSYKYDIKKHKMTFSGNLFLFFGRIKPIPPNLINPNAVCVTNCPKWGHSFRLSMAVGKYF